MGNKQPRKVKIDYSNPDESGGKGDVYKQIRAWDPPEFPGAPEFPDSIESLTFIQELDGSSKPQQMSYKGFYFVVKKSLTSAEQLQCEFAVSNAYRAAGIRCPLYRLYGSGDELRMVGQWINGKTLRRIDWNTLEYKNAAKKLQEGFVLDCLFGNWDVVGKVQDNIIVDANGEPWRIDNGGSLSFRAMGEKKTPQQWGADSTAEFKLMRTRNEKMERIYGSITEEQVKAGVERALKYRDAILACIPESEKAVLNSRFDFLKNHQGDWLT